MGNRAADRIDQTCPVWNEFTGAVATDPVAAGTLFAEDVPNINFGTVAASANSNARALVLQFPSDFPDTLYTKGSRLYLINKPQDTGHTIAAEYATAALLPAVSLTAVLAGATAAPLGGSYYKAATTHIKTTDIYTSADNRLATFIVQLQVGATPRQRWVDGGIHSSPLLTLVSPRVDYDTENRILEADRINADEETGHLLSYPNTRLYFITNYGTSSEAWHHIEDVNENSLELTEEKTLLDYKKGRPSVTMHQTVSEAMGSLAFTSTMATPMLNSIALQTSASRNSTERMVTWENNGCACINGVREFAYAIEYQTLGGFLCHKIIERGVLKRSGAYGGGDEYTQHSFEVSALAKGTCRTLVKHKVSDTPVIMSTLPLVYRVGS